MRRAAELADTGALDLGLHAITFETTIANTATSYWCEEQDLNLHALRQRNLKVL
jgi:hypothetical protein